MPEVHYSYDSVPTIKDFSNSNKRIRGLMGPFGSGKSSGCVIELITRAHMQEPGPDGVKRVRYAVIRNTYPQLRDTTIKTLHDWLPPVHCGKWNKAAHEYLITCFKNVEIEILFRALDRPDHVSNLLSLELTGAWVNEAREVPWAIIEALDGRIARYPSKRNGGCTYPFIILDTNPPDDDSRWFKYFEEIKPKNAAIFKQPSGLSDEAENMANLPSDYYENLALGKDEEFIKVYVDGEYGYVQDGKPVYSSYNDRIHCQEFDIHPSQEIRRGWDFGLTPACSFSQMQPNGQWRVFDELVSEDMGIERFADIVNQHCRQNYNTYQFLDYGDPAGNSKSQTDEKTCFQILKAKGIDIKSGIQSPTSRLEAVRKPLNTMVDGEPGFLLHPRCKVLRKGFMGRYQFRRLKVSNDRYTDKPDKNEYSHIHDALQYDATQLFTPTIAKKKSKPIKRNQNVARQYY